METGILTPGFDTRDFFGSYPSAAGVPINYDTVWNIAPFVRGVDLIANKLATINCDVLLDKGGNKEQYKTHPVFKVLRGNAAPWLPAADMIKNLVKDAIWAGNGYAKIIRKNPIQLIPLDPRHVQPWITRDLETFEVLSIMYRVTMHGVEQDIPFSDMIHIKGSLPECGCLWGMPILEKCKDVLGLCSATVKYGSAYFRSAIVPHMVIQLPQWLKDKKQKEEFDSLINKRPGPDDMWKTVILQNGATATFPPPVSNENAQFLGSMEQAAIICSQILGLPASKLGARSENSSYNSLSADELSIYKDTYCKWMQSVENEFCNKLLSEKEKASGLVSVEFNRQQLLEGDPQQVITLLGQQVEIGELTLNEARAKLNLPKANHPNADKHRMPSHSVFMEDIIPPTTTMMQAEGMPQTPEILDQKPPSGHDQARALTEISIERLVKRLRKAGKDFTSHRSVMMEALSPFERATDWIDALLGELEHVLPEQVEAVLDRVDVKKVSETLWMN